MKYFRIVKITFLAACIAFISGCDYLDLVPEGDPTLETAFSNRVNSEKYLFTCYSRLPNPVSAFGYPALIGGDEMWWDHDSWTAATDAQAGIAIASGYQEANNPWQNYWDGGRGGSNIFQAIRDCNIFLENIHNPYDIEEYEREQWIAEVKFLKAYYHFFLMQLYGPIPIIRENLPVSAPPDAVRLYREPVEDVTEYIVELLDEAVPGLPVEHLIPLNDAGRITQAIALSVKAKVLVWAASPLFNGNGDYTTFKDKKGRTLIPSGSPDPEKWRRATEAIKDAIDACHLARHTFYQFTPGMLSNMSPEIQLNHTLRGAVTERFNSEIVWPSTHGVYELQHWCMPLLESGNYNTRANEIGATLKIAEQYYTRNGLPIDEDPEWDYAGRYTTQVAGDDHKVYIKKGETTAKLNFAREPRFYASLGFDRGIFEGSGRTDENNYYYIQARQGEVAGMRSMSDHLVTGYHIKKLINVATAFAGNTTTYNEKRYSYPLIRLTDLFLLYAEALNEIGGPSDEVYKWIDTVRLRAGIPGIEESYAKAAPQFRNKPYEKETLREIIKRERLIELAFEGQRFWDLRRWKDAFRYYNEPVRGWNYRESSINGYYVVTSVWEKRVFNTRDYLWPLKISSIITNSNLVQNPGW
jgi:hypothetical protein